MPQEDQGWSSYQRMVLTTLERLEANDTAQNKVLTTILVELGKLKIKSGVWGAIGGLIPISLGVAMWALSKL